MGPNRQKAKRSQVSFQPHVTCDSGRQSNLGRYLDLVSGKFDNRSTAFDLLVKIGPAAAAQLQLAQQKRQSVDKSLAIRKLLRAYETMEPDSDTTRRLRSIEVLERIGGEDAIVAIARVAHGHPGSFETISAENALAQLRQ